MAIWRRDRDSGRNEHEPLETSAATTEEEWRKTLTEEQFYVCRMKGTEPPFSGKYYANKADGSYLCVACGSELFSSDTKFDSGTGWPSFWAPVEKETSRHGSGRQLRDEESRGPVPSLRISPGTRLRRRAPSHRPALLHQFGGPGLQGKTRQISGSARSSARGSGPSRVFRAPDVLLGGCFARRRAVAGSVKDGCPRSSPGSGIGVSIPLAATWAAGASGSRCGTCWP